MTESKSVRSKVVSIDKSRFHRRQESARSKLKCIELTIYQIFLRIFPDTVNFGVVQNTFLNLVFKEHGIAHWASNYFVADDRNAEKETPNTKTDQLKTAFPRRACYIAQSLHNTRTFIIIYTLAPCSFYNHLLLSSIELTFGFDRNNLRLNWLAAFHVTS